VTVSSMRRAWSRAERKCAGETELAFWADFSIRSLL